VYGNIVRDFKLNMFHNLEASGLRFKNRSRLEGSDDKSQAHSFQDDNIGPLILSVS
jgi:hypothetical protein